MKGGDVFDVCCVVCMCLGRVRGVVERFGTTDLVVRHSIVASIPACHAGDRGPIPRRGAVF